MQVKQYHCFFREVQVIYRKIDFSTCNLDINSAISKIKIENQKVKKLESGHYTF